MPRNEWSTSLVCLDRDAHPGACRDPMVLRSVRQCLVEDTRVESALVDRLAATNAAGLVSAYLFGSHAENRAHRESDVDVGVLLDWKTYPTAADRAEAELGLIAELTHAAHRRPVDVVILNDAPPTFARHVLTRGRRIVCRDAEADHAFLRDTLLRAADLERS